MTNKQDGNQESGIGPKILSVLSEKGVTGLLNHTHTVLLHRIHERLFPSPAFGSEPAPTTEKVDLDELTIDSDNKEIGVHYAPTPRLVFRWVHDLLPNDQKNYTFIDVGAGRGRIVMMAMEQPYARVIGCEFAKELAEDARQNIAACPENLIKARTVEIVHADATEFNISDGPCIFFLFNPFDGHVMQGFLDNALQSYAGNQREMIFVYVNPVEDHVFKARTNLKEKKLPVLTKLKLVLLSPYAVKIYVTI